MENQEKVCGIYCIENLINGKKYIGYSSNVAVRWKKHVYDLQANRHNNQYLQNVWNLQGEENFSFYVIERCDEELLSEREIYYIDKFNTVSPNGYNLTFGGEGGIFSDETRIKLSKALSGENNPMYGKHHSETSKIKLSKANTGQIRTEEFKLKVSKRVSGKNNPMYGKTGDKNPMYGKHHTRESRDKMSNTLKGRFSGENNPFYGKTHTDETKAKLSEMRIGKPLSPETKDKLSKSLSGENNPNYGKITSDETKNKISEGLKRYYRKKRKLEDDTPNTLDKS